MMGDNWFYIASLKYLNGKDKKLNSDLSIAWSEAFSLTPKQAMNTGNYFVPAKK